MENSIDTNLDLFNPKKAELQELAAKFKDLKINWIDDKTWYKLVHEAQMTLRWFRTNIQKTRLAYTKQFDEAKAKAMWLEKELLAIITPIEDSLKEQKEAIDAEKERIRQEEEEKKRKFIQDRADILKQYEYFDFDFYALWMMTEEWFKELVEQKKAEFEEKKAKIQQEEKEKIINSIRLNILNSETLEKIQEIENQINNTTHIEWIEIDFSIFSKEIESKKKTLESEKKLKEAQRVIDEQNAKIAKEKEEKINFRKQQMMKVFWKIIEWYIEIDDIDFMEKIQEQEKENKDAEEKRIQAAKEEWERKAKEDAEKAEKARKDKEEAERIEKEAKEKEEAEKLAKRKAYQEFLEKNWITQEKIESWEITRIQNDDLKTITFYKKIDSFNYQNM